MTEKEMKHSEGSLRRLIEKWVGPTEKNPIRVSRYRDISPSSTYCVRVEADGSVGSFSLFFFRHSDGCWRVFPPENKRPTMSVY
jgi:hypothetical protein